MKKVLIINGHQYYDVVARGELTNKIIEKATKFFENNGFEVKYTHIEKGYDVKEECEKFEWADAVLFQYPVYWMGLPWIAKKYFDETFTQGRHYVNDGRSRSDESKRYGSVRVGIVGKSDSRLLTYAAVNEYGANIKITPKMRKLLPLIGIFVKSETTHIVIPERSYIRATFDNKKVFDKLKKKIQPLSKIS